MTIAIRVIVVDDYQPIRDVMRALLSSIGCEVIGTADNGKKGLVLFQETRPDLTFMDIEMPVMNGLDALKGIMKADPDANVVMLTSVDDTVVAETCLMNGARDYVQKHIDPSDLMSKLQDLINRFQETE